MGHFNWEINVRVLLGLMATIATCQGFTDPRDVVAMNLLYAALGSPPLPGWLPAAGDPCAEGWQGVQCVNGNITGIILNGENLGGELGKGLGFFASIIQIELSNNHIGGSIPSSLPVSIRSFDLSGNQFIGSIPEAISYLSQLTDMSLNNNHLTGVIPDSFQQLTGLTNLDLSGNNLDGQLPPSMGNLSSVTKLHLQDNHLIGTLDILQDLPLIDLNIENNLFSGPIPQKLMSIPNFRRAGNSFNTTDIPSTPFSPPARSSSGALPPEEVPRSQPNEPSAPKNSHSSKGQKFLTTKKVVGIAIAGLIIVIVIVVGFSCLFMSTCFKGRPLSKKFPKKHEMYVNDEPKNNLKHTMLLPKPYIHTGKALKEEAKSAVADRKIYGRNNSIPKPKAKQEKEMEELAAVPKHEEEDGERDMTGIDENILPPPPLPSLLHPFEMVIAKPNLPQVTSKRHNMERLSSARTFSIASLQQYTNSFSQENLVGGGMLGTVYRAELPDGKLLAVKKLDIAASRKQSDEDFIELVSRLSKFQHVNTVQLVGFCAEHEQRLLVYEYFGNGTVYEALHIDDEIKKHLSWDVRIRLALQAARALEYLHEVCQPPVVHQNFKSANVLLDDGFAVRVSDCGLAPLISSNYITQFQCSGCGAPELEMGSFTCQSDVYSFGVVMLELLTGRKSCDRSRPRGEQFLGRWAAPQLHDIDALSRMVDPSLKGTYSSKSLSRLADIISLCIQPEPEFRPPISEIAEDLLHMLERDS